jgi:hypothetical protein
MSKRLNSKLGILFLCVHFLIVGISSAAESHSAEALKHVQEAIEYGKQGNGDQLMKHASTALKHAEAAQKEKADASMAEGLQSLQKAIDHAKGGQADMATKAAEDALQALRNAAVRDTIVPKAPPTDNSPTSGY